MKELFFDKIDKMNRILNECSKEQEQVDLANYLGSKGLLPVLKDDKLYIYKISISKKLYELAKYYRNNLVDDYRTIVSEKDFYEDFFNNRDPLKYKNMINHHKSTAKEIYEQFGLGNEINQKKFIEENAKEVEIKTKINDEEYTKSYRKETVDEIVNRICNNYVTCVCQRKSKLAEIILFILHYNFYNIDFINELAYDFLYNKELIYNKIIFFTQEQLNIQNMTFSNKERVLSEDDKLAIVKKIIEACSFETIYCEDIDKISNHIFLPVLSEFSDKVDMIVNLARHNNDVIENSVFSSIIIKIINSNNKVLVKKMKQDN